MIHEMTQSQVIKDPDQWDITALQIQFRSTNRCFPEPDLEDPFARSHVQSLSQTSSNAGRALVKTSGQKRRASNNFASNLFNRNKLGLKKVLKEQKVKQIINTFREKIKRNITSASPVQYQPYERQEAQGIWSEEGLVLPQKLDLALAAFSILLTIGFCFIFTLSLVFEEIFLNQGILNFQMFIIVFYGVEIFLNFLVVKTIDGRKLSTLKEISANYAKNKLKMDLAFLIILIADVTTQAEATKYLRLFVLLKIKECLSKMQKIENILLTNFYKEQYWSLAKVFLVNFAFAHCLAVLLIAMSWLSKEYNWLDKFGVSHSQWFQIYAWSYYWGTTTMLTVGFGDLNPANYKQAICLTMIETFSCILLAYNINCVGTLISNIRSQDIQKNKNLKIMRRLAKQNKITDDLEWRVCNFINESDKMRKKFQFDTEKEFISNLPEELKGQFLKQSNTKLFKGLPFFSSLTEKTLLALAEQIQVKIAHPQEIIFKGGDPHQFLILRGGKVGYCTKIPEGDFNNSVIDIVKLKKEESPKFLHLNFFTNELDPKYTIKSVEYSILAILNFQKVLDYLRGSACDFQNFCQIRDKSKHVLDEFETLTCQNCRTKHSKMKCPKLHFIPIQQQLIYRYLQSVKKGRCSRKKMRRLERHKIWAPLKKYNEQFKTFQQMILGRKIQSSIQKKGIAEIRKEKKMRSQMGMGCGKEIFKSEEFLKGERKRQESFAGIEHYLKNKLVDKVVCGVSERISSLLSQKPIEDKAFFNWNIDCDELKNFNYYYSKFNPENLSSISLSQIRDPLSQKARKELLLNSIFSSGVNSSQHN